MHCCYFSIYPMKGLSLKLMKQFKLWFNHNMTLVSKHAGIKMAQVLGSLVNICGSSRGVHLLLTNDCLDYSIYNVVVRDLPVLCTMILLPSLYNWNPFTLALRGARQSALLKDTTREPTTTELHVSMPQSYACLRAKTQKTMQNSFEFCQNYNCCTNCVVNYCFVPCSGHLELIHCLFAIKRQFPHLVHLCQRSWISRK